MDTPLVQEDEGFDWGFLIDITLVSSISLEVLRNMTLKGVFYTQAQAQELFQAKMSMGAMAGLGG